MKIHHLVRHISKKRSHGILHDGHDTVAKTLPDSEITVWFSLGSDFPLPLVLSLPLLQVHVDLHPVVQLPGVVLLQLARENVLVNPIVVDVGPPLLSSIVEMERIVSD